MLLSKIRKVLGGISLVEDKDFIFKYNEFDMFVGDLKGKIK